MLEVGRAQKTIFLCRYLRDRDPQREVNSGLNVAERWNRANAEIFYGKARDIASNRRDEQEMSVLCLHILQAAMVYVNTLMLQDVLAEDEWSQLLTSEDDRGLTPLTWAHVAIHGEFKLNTNSPASTSATPVRKRIGLRACGRVLVRRCGRPRAVKARSRSQNSARFRVSRMRRWLRPRDTSGHDGPRDEEGEPP